MVSLPLKSQVDVKNVYTTFKNECYMYNVSGNGQIQKRLRPPDGCVQDTTVGKIITKDDEVTVPVITKEGSFDSKIKILSHKGKGYEALEAWIPKEDKAPDERTKDYTSYFKKRLESVTPLNLSSVYFNQTKLTSATDPLIKDQTSCVRTLIKNNLIGSFIERTVIKMECTTINAELCGIAKNTNSGTDDVSRVQHAFKVMYGGPEKSGHTKTQNANYQIAGDREKSLRSFSLNIKYLAPGSIDYKQTIAQLIKPFEKGESRQQGGAGSERYQWAFKIAGDVIQRCDKFFPPRNSSDTNGVQTGGSQAF